MSAKSLIRIAIMAALAVFGVPTLASAQTVPAPYGPPSRHARPRIVITPRQLYQRRCIDWLELQHRPSGTVLYPQYRCWWVTR